MNKINSLSEFNKFVSNLEPMEIGMLGGRRFKEKGSSTANYSLKEIVDKMKTLIAERKPNQKENASYKNLNSMVSEANSTLGTLKQLDKESTSKVNSLDGIIGRIKQLMTFIKQYYNGFDRKEFVIVGTDIDNMITLDDLKPLLEQEYFNDTDKENDFERGLFTQCTPKALYLQSGNGHYSKEQQEDYLLRACNLLTPEQKSNLKIIFEVFYSHIYPQSNDSHALSPSGLKPKDTKLKLEEAKKLFSENVARGGPKLKESIRAFEFFYRYFFDRVATELNTADQIFSSPLPPKNQEQLQEKLRNAQQLLNEISQGIDLRKRNSWS